jgi:uncharacterized protein (TIGR03437 family)
MMLRTLLGSCLLSVLLSAQPGQPPQQAGDGIWLRNALFGEAVTFDRCLAHQPQNGQYHNHVQPVCLRAQLNDNVQVVYTGRTGPIYQEKVSGWTHSPILGWSFDGYPVYGPYGYSDPKNPASPVQRMRSSFRLRSIAKRTSLPDWALAFHPGIPQQLAVSQYGPDVSTLYPLGRYVEDYDYVAGLGDLDQYNGRFTVTPDFPNGTYAYFATIDDDGSPAFPFIMGMQYYGTPANSRGVTVPSTAQAYFANGAVQSTAATGPQLTTWMTKNSAQPAQVVSGWDPSAGPSTTWPGSVPAGVHYGGGVSSPTAADTQEVRYTGDSVYVNSNGLASYTMGPWFSEDTGGVFLNWPSAQNTAAQIPRSPAVAAAKTTTPGGAIGILVNGVAIFNALDQQSWSNSQQQDSGPAASPAAIHVSSASYEGGPMAPGSLVSAYPLFGAVLAGSGNTSAVSVTDSAGKTHAATVLYASPSLVNYQLPPDVADGVATVTVNGVSGSIYVVDSYPNLFMQSAGGLAAAQIVRVRGGAQTVEAVTAAPVDLAGSDSVYLVLYGSGMGKAAASTVTATVAGAPVTVAYAGPQGSAGLDQFNLLLPASLAGKGRMDVVVKIDGRVSNPVNLTVQ